MCSHINAIIIPDTPNIIPAIERSFNVLMLSAPNITANTPVIIPITTKGKKHSIAPKTTLTIPNIKETFAFAFMFI